MTNTNERHKVGDRVSIVKRGQKGNYQAEFHLDGQHCRKSLKTTNKRTALDRASKLNMQLLTGEFESSPQESTLVDAIEQYLNFHRIEDKARRTIVKYRGQLSEFRRFCQKHRIVQLSQIRPSILDAFRQFRKPSLKPRSMYHEGGTIKQWLKWCVSRQLIKENPLAACRIEEPKLRPPNPSPTLEEVWRIIHACREPLRFHVATLAFTSLAKWRDAATVGG